MKRLLALALSAAWAALAPLAAPALAAEPIKLLFVGNSYTFGRVDPVLTYNAAHVHDLTAGFNAVNPTGTNSYPSGTPGFGSFEPHPWGGVPGLFKQMADEAGLSYDVSLSTRNAASLRGHFLNIYNADWDLRGNVASQAWDQVVLQELSDGALPVGKSKNANPAAFNAYAGLFERFIHAGAAQAFTEAQLHGGLEACLATRTPAPERASTWSRPGRGPTWWRRTRTRRPTSPQPMAARARPTTTPAARPSTTPAWPR
jgi:hypothetical protein